MKIWVSTLLFISQSALGQLDPSSGLLLNGDSKSSHIENGLDSGRYTVRKKLTLTKTTNTEKSVEKEEDEIQSPGPTATPSQVQLPAVQSQMPSAKLNSPNPAVEPPAASSSATAPNSQPMTTANGEQKSNDSNSEAKPLDIKDLSETTGSPIDDRKRNIIEINIAPVFVYNHSSSDMSTRNYTSSGPAYLLDVEAWLHPNFAFHAQILNSLATSVNDSYDKSKNANLNQQWISGGFRYRNFLSSQKNSASVTVGADYEDYQFQVDSDAQIRNRFETSGIDLSLTAEIPQSSRYSWEFGIEFMPKAKHIENATTSGVQSGDSPDADMIGISVGGKIYVDSANQMFWKVTERIEKDQFSGNSSMPDPATNQTLTNVSVTNTFTMIQIGYSWGN